MQLNRIFPKRALLPVLTLCFLSFTLLSWWLFFRDERALSGWESAYPVLSGQLWSLREWLLARGLNVLPTIAFAGVGILACVVSFLSLRSPFPRRTILKAAVLFQVITFLSYPILSTDIFSYMFSDRVFTEHQQNIWKVTPDTFHDHFEPFADWKDQTKVYGAVNQILYLPAAYLGNDDIFLTLLLYKATAAAFGVGCIWILLRLTKDLSEKQQSIVLQTILWSPLLLLETFGAGHNDIIMIFFLLVSLALWKEQRWALAGLFLGLSVQIKLIPILMFAFFALSLLQKKNLPALIRYGTAFLGVHIAAFLYMQVNPIEFLQRVLYNTSVYWQSLPAVVERFFPGQPVPFTLGLLLFGLALVYLQITQKWHPVFTTAVGLLVYLLFFAAAYWNWYVLWILALVPFLKQTWIKNGILVFTFTSLMAYPLLWLSQRYGFGHPFWPILTWLWIFGVPVISLVAFFRKPDLLQKLVR